MVACCTLRVVAVLTLGLALAGLLHGAPSAPVWGTYRPNLYCGMRTDSPKSLVTGLMWYSVNDPRGLDNVRHDAEADELDRYGYTRHDGSSYSAHEMVDGHNNLVLNTQVVQERSAGDKGGHWTLRITGKPKTSHAFGNMSLIFYAALEGPGEFKMAHSNTKKGIEGDLRLDGKAEGVGYFSIVMPKGPNNKHPKAASHAVSKRNRNQVDLTRVHYSTQRIDPELGHRVQDFVIPQLRQQAAKMAKFSNEKFGSKGDKNKRGKGAAYKTGGTDGSGVGDSPIATLPNSEERNANLVAIQVVFSGSFELDIVLVSHAGVSKSSTTKPKDSDIKAAAGRMSGKSLSGKLSQRTSQFDKKFDQVFRLVKDDKQKKMAVSALANVVGGIGYFYGDSQVYNTTTKKSSFGEESGLLTGTPCRHSFPRGFLWDEGFHQLIVGEWDFDLSSSVIRSWLNQMDENGWIAREQIRGEEARAKVPEQFQTQHPGYANPPTLLLACRRILERVTGQITDSEAATTTALTTLGKVDESLAKTPEVQFLESVFPQLDRWWHWFVTTQRGEAAYSFRWRGKTDDHTLTSGLDDYPRGPVPVKDERHLDLTCWMAVAARIMATLADALGHPTEEYTKYFDGIMSNFEENHYNKEIEMYSDYAGNLDVAKLLGHEDVSEFREVYVPTIGYMNLFPFLFGMVPADSPILERIFAIMRDPKQLWSVAGLRSLSKAEPTFGSGENYWRGPVWINLNYLSLAALKRYYVNVEGPYQAQAKQLYASLRSQIIANVGKEWKRTGYFWEQYNPLKGHGQRLRQFNGWTSLVLLIQAEIY